MVDTITQYRSPVRLVLHAAEATSPYSPQAIARARKKMMAEIALAGDEVVIDDVAYSRNDAATLLDGISEEAWRVHCIVYTCPGLLAFLEQQAFSSEALKKADAYLYDQRFVKVISPPFAYSFNAVSGVFLRNDSFDELVQLLRYQGYILPEHQHEAFQKIRSYLDELSYTLRNLSWEKFETNESILHFVFEEAWQTFLNALPPSFNTLRDEVVDHLVQVVLRFQQKATWYYLHQVLLNLRNLETNDFNRQEITRIDGVIYENVQLESKGKLKKEGQFSSRYIWLGVWVLLIILRAVTCNNRTNRNYDSNSYTYEPAISMHVDTAAERQNEHFFLYTLDSLFQKQTLGVLPTFMTTGDQPFAEFADDPSTAKNDSLLVMNDTGFDAVFLYFKDVPDHSRSGQLPKMYATLIKNSEKEKVYVQAGNGRVYFAFGRDWGELRKPIAIPLPYRVSTVSGFIQEDSVVLTHFFSTGKGLHQHYLTHPLYMESFNTQKDTDTYHYFNTKPPDGNDKITIVHLRTVSGNIVVGASGHLTVKEDLSFRNFVQDGVMPPAQEKD